MGMDRKMLEEKIRGLKSEGTGAKRDLLPLYANAEAAGALAAYLAEPYKGLVDFVCAPEPLGFIVGSMLARELGVGMVAIRRDQQFWIDPEEHVTASYINHKDKVTMLITERCLLPAGSRVLIADDWMSTAATVQAMTNLIEDAGCKVAGIAAVGVDNRDLVGNKNVRCVYCDK